MTLQHRLFVLCIEVCVWVCVCVCVHREGAALEPLSACRIHGHIYVNKVAGNFHITVGK